MWESTPSAPQSHIPIRRLHRSDRNLKGVARFKHAALPTPQNQIRDGSVEDDAANEDDDKTSVVQGPWKHITHTC
jgi:hypothetical protein